jgi:hypothetical protein
MARVAGEFLFGKSKKICFAEGDAATHSLGGVSQETKGRERR